jgi:hypothetical protein
MYGLSTFLKKEKAEVQVLHFSSLVAECGTHFLLVGMALELSAGG